MQVCFNCRSQQMNGTIFCSECGANLIAPVQRETTASLGQFVPAGASVAPVVSVPAPPVNDPAAVGTATTVQLDLVILNSGRRVQLDVSDDLLIGRRDDARGIIPDVDLNPDGGYDAGVSRRHAILSYKDGTYRVEDLGSANGTFVNGRQVPPQTPVPLANGDELKCAMLLMRVEIG